MKISNFLLAAAGLLAMTSCSNDELKDVNRDGDEISFNVVTNAGTRAADVYCNNNMPGSFEVWALTGGKTYIGGDAIANEGGKWVNKSGTRYWPEGEVSFYAQENAGDAFSWNDGAPTIDNFTVAAAVADQKDLVYAVKTTAKPNAAGQVTLNFRHALSQIVFAAKNTNKNLYVEVSGVSVCKVGDTNTFTYGTGDTDDNIVNHEGTAGNITYGDNWGTWAALTGGEASFGVDFDAVAVAGDNTAVALTSANDADKEFNANAMLLLPQTTAAWAVEGENVEGKPADQEGTYFLVKCTIWNVAGDTFNKDTDICLWGKDGAKEIAIPVAFNWEQGKKYLYTFVFGEGNGGYDPEEPDPDDPDPDPVLVPISFAVTVDDFVPVASTDVEIPKFE